MTMYDERFQRVEPLIGIAGMPWARVATNEAKAPGTFVHIGYPDEPHAAALTFEVATQLYEWLGRVLRHPALAAVGDEVQRVSDDAFELHDAVLEQRKACAANGCERCQPSAESERTAGARELLQAYSDLLHRLSRRTGFAEKAEYITQGFKVARWLETNAAPSASGVVEALRNANGLLRRYGSHDSDCPRSIDQLRECECGYVAALQRVTDALSTFEPGGGK